MNQPLIFDIVRGSTVDGPGIRTTVFFKGCNLSCAWCHNPEGKSAGTQPAFFADKCLGCGACRRVCAKTEGCTLCGKCVEACPAGARKIYGKRLSPEEIIAIIAKDKLFYDACGGGATFSGGECMLYPEFLAECARLCKEAAVSVAIDTAGCVPFANFSAVLPYADIFLYDIKCISPDKHKKFTGADNKLILENFAKLIKTNKTVIVRVPVVNGFNSDKAEMDKIKNFLSGKNVKVEYLPYHDMGISKEKALTDGKKIF